MPAVNPIQSSLINATFPPTSLHRAILEKKPLSEIIPLINQSSVNDITNVCTPLHLSITTDQPLLTEFLLSQGADPSILNVIGDNALHISVVGKRQACLEKIVNSPAGRQCINAKNRYSNTPLYLAVDEGNLPAVTTLLNGKADVNEKNGAHDDSTALHLAAGNNHVDIVRALIDAKANLESENKAVYTPLQVACHNGKEQAAEILIRAGANTEVKSKSHKRTLIHEAAEFNQAGIIRLLHRLKPTTNLETLTGPGYTALSTACSYGNKLAAEALLEAGAKVDTKIGPVEITALHVAAMNGQARMIPLLLNAKANIEEITTEGVTPLGMAFQRKKEEAAAALIKAGANVENIGNLGNETLLYWVTDRNWASVIRSLRERYPSLDLEAKSHDVTALVRACDRGYSEAVQALLEVGAKVNTPCQNKLQAIHYAARAGHTKIISLLLDAGAKVEEKTGQLQTPLYIACGEGKLEAADVLIKRDANVRSKNNQTEMTPLHGAAGAKENSAALIRLLHEKKVDIEAKTTQGATALCVACDLGNLEGAKALLEVGANANAETNVKITPLHLAASKGHSDIIRLLAPKANLEAKADGYTPLGLACEEGKLAAAEALIAGGAKVDAPNKETGQTPLHLAVSSSRQDIIRLLHRANANFDCTNAQDVTPLGAACAGKQTEIVKLLLELGANPNAPNGKMGLTALHDAVVSNYPEGIPLLASKADLEAKNLTGHTALYLACFYGKIDEALALIEAGAKIETKNGPNQLTVMDVVPAQFALRLQEAVSARAEWEAMNRPVDGKTIRDLLEKAKPPINPKEIENLRVIPETKRYLSAT